MLDRSPWWLARQILTDAERHEIARATPIHFRVRINRMDRWGDGWKCSIYDTDSRVVGETVMERGPMDAFREALRQTRSYAEWNGTLVEVVEP